MGNSYLHDSELVGLIAVAGILAIIIALLILAFGVVTYILKASGMYTLAKRRGIRNPWLSWIPIANKWILGSVSDQYQYLVKGKDTNRRMILLVLALVSTVVGGACSRTYFNLFAAMVNEIVIIPELGGSLAAIGGVGFLTAILSIAALVYRLIALYDYYTSCKPENSVLFLVLSIIFPVTEPFFIFACRRKDGGMPPRKAAHQEQTRYRSSEPWNDGNMQ